MQYLTFENLAIALIVLWVLRFLLRWFFATAETGWYLYVRDTAFVGQHSLDIQGPYKSRWQARRRLARSYPGVRIWVRFHWRRPAGAD